ncbi:MAG: hypothetical protein IJK56_01550 [Firmicutes bacterium]|nr:hypothetical protein [Bacillota bacterium]
MKTDVIRINTQGTGIEAALNQAEAVSAYKGLAHKDGLHLRLLTEEMMGMVRAITGEHDLQFWIEDKDDVYQLHLVTRTAMDAEKRSGLLSAATSGKNAAAVGILGKIRDVFERSMDSLNEYPESLIYGFVSEESTGNDMAEMNARSAAMEWSLKRYRESLEQELAQHKEEWDQFEKSIIAKLADEVIIYIKGNQVELVVFKKL